MTEKQKDLLKVILAWALIIGLEIGWVLYLFVFDAPLPF